MTCAWRDGCEQPAERDADRCYFHRKREADLILDDTMTAPGRWPSVASLERERTARQRRRARLLDRLIEREAAKEETAE